MSPGFCLSHWHFLVGFFSGGNFSHPPCFSHHQFSGCPGGCCEPCEEFENRIEPLNSLKGTLVSILLCTSSLFQRIDEQLFGSSLEILKKYKSPNIGIGGSYA